ncbi:Succinate dehydrogenase assembly factor 2 mitochondrial [Tilletia horrida]|uniref:Succinate dehydrogenase assembly factor 2, mitochondrial n=1 Tax=Tilletia horrida TaxID=155126 RepID=A0AAN6GMR1_9BASI|nr:Succinate dehydrogenase assembly factor 2 mitochondrial [Tilletia horrida]
MLTIIPKLDESAQAMLNSTTTRSITVAASTSRAALTPAAARTWIAPLAAAAAAGRRSLTASSVAASEPFDRPGPVPLPAKEQREFEKLVREKANSLQFSSAQKGGEEAVHPDLRRKPAPDFEGETNPETGEVGGPKKDPLKWEREWTYGDRRQDSAVAAHPKDQPPSKASDPFPLPFDPSLASSSIEGTPPDDLSSSSQLDGLPTFTFTDDDDAAAAEALANSAGLGDREVYSPMTRVPGRTPLTEDRERTIARLVYQVRKRGTLETDLLLSTFAKTELKKLPDEELLEFDRLLDEPDWDIFYWATDRKPVPERWATSFSTPGRLGHRLRKHTKNEEKVPRRMPDLD